MTSNEPAGTRRLVLLAASHLLRAYIQYFPVRYGKLAAWNRIGRPYLAWRNISVLGKTRQAITIRGPLSDTIHGNVFFFGAWEPALTAFLARSLRPGDVFVDIGANVGVHTMLAARCVADAGRVHAIEASPTIAAMLNANLTRNRLTNVTVHNVAVSNSTGSIDLFLHNASNFGASSTLRSNGGSDTAQRVEQVAMKPLLDIVPEADLKRARVIKIDVEGAEWQVLEGMWSVLPTLHRDVSIVVEVNRQALETHGASIDDLLRKFRNHGYVGAQLQGHSAALCIEGTTGDLLPMTNAFDMADIVFRRGGASK